MGTTTGRSSRIASPSRSAARRRSTAISTHAAIAGYAGRTIGLKLRYDNFRTVTRDQTIATPTQDAETIRRAAGECLKRVTLDRRIRLLGVRIGALIPVEHVGVAIASEPDPTPSLF